MGTNTMNKESYKSGLIDACDQVIDDAAWPLFCNEYRLGRCEYSHYAGVWETMRAYSNHKLLCREYAEPELSRITARDIDAARALVGVHVRGLGMARVGVIVAVTAVPVWASKTRGGALGGDVYQDVYCYLVDYKDGFEPLWWPGCDLDVVS